MSSIMDQFGPELSELPALELENLPYLTLFNPFPNKPWFFCVCSTNLLKTLWEKDKLLVMSNLSFSHSVLYPFE